MTSGSRPSGDGLSGKYAEPFASVRCPKSGRADLNHSWRWDGDESRIICVYCAEVRDGLTGRALAPSQDSEQ